jgi:hypothetical protein
VPKRALNIINVIGGKIVQAKTEWVRICKVKELIEVEIYKQKLKQAKEGGIDIDSGYPGKNAGDKSAEFGDPKKLDKLEEEYLAFLALWTQL